MTEVPATTVRDLIGAEATDDAQHILAGFIDIAGQRHVFALPFERALEFFGFMTTALKTALSKSGKSERESRAIVVENFEVGGDETQKLVSMTLRLAPGADLDFCLNPSQSTNLSEALAASAARLNGNSGVTLN